MRNFYAFSQHKFLIKVAGFIPLLFLSVLSYGQPPATHEFTTSLVNPNLNSPKITNFIVNSYKNTDNPTGITAASNVHNVTFSLQNNQYTLPTTQLAPGVGLVMGGAQNSGGLLPLVTPVKTPMDLFSSPTSSIYSSAPTNIGTGITLAATGNENTQTTFFASANALQNNNGGTSRPTNGRYLMGQIKITLPVNVNNPVLHLTGLGESFNGLGFSAELELVTPNVTMSKLSGTSELAIDATGKKILNSSTSPTGISGSGAASGSVVLNGIGVTEIVLNVFLEGNGATTDWTTLNTAGTTPTAHAGDQFGIGLSFLDCTTPAAPTGVQATLPNLCTGEKTGLIGTCVNSVLQFFSNAALTTLVPDPANVTPAASTTYYAACVHQTCISTGVAVPVTVNITPTATPTVAITPNALLIGESATLSGSGCTTGTLTWSTDQGGLNPVVGTTVTPSQTTTYYARCVLNGCRGPVVTKSLPVVTRIVPCNEICTGNVGLAANDDACAMDYDAMVAGSYSTIIKGPNCEFKIWGQNTNNGTTNYLVPTTINKTNFSTLTGQVLMATSGEGQHVILTSTGLFSMGTTTGILPSGAVTGATFQQPIVDGKLDGLPQGVSPFDVKMMMATEDGLVLTTKQGYVYVLSNDKNSRGDNNQPEVNQWAQVRTDSVTPLSNVCVTRGAASASGPSFVAIKKDGTVWTWGTNTYLGNATASTARPYATQMTLPAGVTPKMIQMSSTGSYHLLGTNGKLYGLGNNTNGILGIGNATTPQTSWVTAKAPTAYTADLMDVAYISSNEHNLAGSRVMTIMLKNGQILSVGDQTYYSSGGPTTNASTNPNTPNGILPTDYIALAETGNYFTDVIKRGEDNVGFVGYNSAGVLGNNTAGTNSAINAYNFTTTAVVNVCGTNCQAVKPIISGNSMTNVCPVNKVNLRPIVTSTPLTGVKLRFYTTPTITSFADSISNTNNYTEPGTTTVYAYYIDETNNCESASDPISVTYVNCVAGTIDCAKTQIYPAPKVGVPGQVDLLVTINVTTPGCFQSLNLTGSGLTLANSYTEICTTTTGIQMFHIPLKYDGSALGTFNFTIPKAGACSADLGNVSPVRGECDIWTLDNCEPVHIAPKIK